MASTGFQSVPRNVASQYTPRLSYHRAKRRGPDNE
jgi:hypothetical protein